MTETVTAGFHPLSLDELFALELPEIDYVVEGILPTESLCLLDGREKSGKGLLSLDLCASVALGEPFLSHAVKEGPTIYCAAEENIRDVRARVAERFGSRRDVPFRVLRLEGQRATGAARATAPRARARAQLPGAAASAARPARSRDRAAPACPSAGRRVPPAT